VRELCAVAGLWCLPLVAAVAVTVAVSPDQASGPSDMTRLCAWYAYPLFTAACAASALGAFRPGSGHDAPPSPIGLTAVGPYAQGGPLCHGIKRRRSRLTAVSRRTDPAALSALSEADIPRRLFPYDRPADDQRPGQYL